MPVYYTALRTNHRILKSASFDYYRATHAAHACELLQQHGSDARLIAGGQSLTPMMAMRLTRPAVLVDINEIEALKFIAIEKDFVRTGACTRQNVAARSDALAQNAPLLRQALSWVGHSQTRNRGTLGGSLAHADPAAELPLVAQTLGATMCIRSTAATRQVSAGDFFSGPLSTCLKANECLEEIHWPVWSEARTGSSFMEVSRRHGDFALIAACAQVAVDADGRCSRATLGLAGGAEIPMTFSSLTDTLLGARCDDDALKAVAHEAAKQLAPGSDLHASAAYRMHLATTLATRVLREAYTQAKAKA